jgi:hypothetical protein
MVMDLVMVVYFSKHGKVLDISSMMPRLPNTNSIDPK